MKPRRQAWQLALAVSVAISVAFSVVLISVAFGVHDDITHSLAIPAVRHSGLVNVHRIDTILALLTVVVTLGLGLLLVAMVKAAQISIKRPAMN